MKFLIWFLCLFANALITVLIKGSGVILGAIPTMLLYGVTIWLARALCKKWDEHKAKKVEQKKNEHQQQSYTIENKVETVDADQIRFCRKCGEKLLEGSRFCRKCGTEIVD